MPKKGQPRLESRTRLAVTRYHAGVTQIEMARRLGVSIATYQRLEERRIPNPPLGYLVNAAIVLDVSVAELIDPEWLTWWTFTAEDRRRRPDIGAVARWK